MRRFWIMSLLVGCIGTPTPGTSDTDVGRERDTDRGDVEVDTSLDMKTNNGGKDVADDGEPDALQFRELTIEEGIAEPNRIGIAQLPADDVDVMRVNVDPMDAIDAVIGPQGRISLNYRKPGPVRIEVQTNKSIYTTTLVVEFKITQIALGSNNGCLLTESGLIYCWGVNGLGDGTDSFSLRPILGQPDFRDVYAGFGKACGVTTDNDAVCWGSNVVNELSDALDTTIGPEQVIDDVITLSLGGSTLCVNSSDGRSRCRGTGNLGPPDTFDEPFNRISHLGNSPTTIDSDVHSTCVSFGSEDLTCWGNNAFGSLNSNNPASLLVRSTLPSNVSNVVMSDHGGCGLLNNGVCCWGQGPFLNYANEPDCLDAWAANSGKFVAIKSSPISICAQNDVGTVWCRTTDQNVVGAPVGDPVAGGATPSVWDVGQNNLCWTVGVDENTDGIWCAGLAQGLIEEQAPGNAPAVVPSPWDE